AEGRVAGDAGVVDQDVDRDAVRGEPRGERLTAVVIGHVHRLHPEVAALPRLCVAPDGGILVAGEAGGHDPVPGVVEGDGDRLADTAGAAGDERGARGRGWGHEIG